MFSSRFSEMNPEAVSLSHGSYSLWPAIMAEDLSDLKKQQRPPTLALRCRAARLAESLRDRLH